MGEFELLSMPEPTTAGRDPQTWVKSRRLTELQTLLESRPRTVGELVRYFGFDEVQGRRKVQRDLAALREMETGVEEVARHTYHIPPRHTSLSAVQTLATHAAVRLLYHHAPARNKHYLEALNKLAAKLPEHVRDVAYRSTRDSDVRLSDKDDLILEQVARAWFERRSIAFDYEPPNAGGVRERRELEVYFVEVSRANLAPYAIGFERLKRGAIRTFKLSRMHNLNLLGDTYGIPESFDPREYLTDAWGVVGAQTEVLTVTLRFAPEAIYRVREGGYPNLTLEEPEDERGRMTVSVRAGVDKTGLPRELMPWILGWGPRVEVLGPENVRAHWLKEAQAVVERYGAT